MSIFSRQAQLFVRGLDAGERDVIAAAAAFSPTGIVLMDDAAGRVVARKAGLSVLGLAGLLVRAREHRLVDRVVPLLYAAREQGYWIDDAVIATVRRLASE